MIDTTTVEAPVAESNPVGPVLLDKPADTGHDPVTFCHKPGTPAQKEQTTDDDGFLNGHLGHGDVLGACPALPPAEETPAPVETTAPVESNPVGPEPVAPPVEVPTVGGVPITDLPLCTLEDGSAPGQVLPCFWDGGPNGTGETYTVVAWETSDPAPALAETGLNTGAGMGIALALLVAGVAAVRLARRNRVAA